MGSAPRRSARRILGTRSGPQARTKCRAWPDDDSIRETASARARLSPRSPWTNQERRGRRLLLGKGAVLGHRLAHPLAAESDEYEQQPARDAGRDARCSFDKRASSPAGSSRLLGRTRSRPRRCWAPAWFPRSERACPTGLCVRPARRGTGGLSRDRRALSSAHPGWERATDQRAVRVARRSLRSPGRRLGHALGHGRVWCPPFESEKPSRAAGFRAKTRSEDTTLSRQEKASAPSQRPADQSI
jgi:hypothetical protein